MHRSEALEVTDGTGLTVQRCQLTKLNVALGIEN